MRAIVGIVPPSDHSDIPARRFGQIERSPFGSIFRQRDDRQWAANLHGLARQALNAVNFGSEGNMCGAAMRGPVALPGSEATSRKKGTRRNLGDLVWPAVA